MKIRVQKRVSLTPRDIFLLNALYENVVLSFSQVYRKVFWEKAKSTVLNRLGKLEGMGVIERWRVPVLDPKRPGPGLFVVFSITKKGIGILAARHTEKEFRDKPARLHGYSIHHDVLLVDVAEALERRFPGSRVTNGRLLAGGEAGTSAAQPDAVLHLAETKERWAVELELTAKSEKRYREIVLRYRLSSAFDRILYVTESREVVQKLARVLDRTPEVLGADPPNEKFLVCRLSDLVPPEKSSGSPQKTTNNNKEIMHE